MERMVALMPISCVVNAEIKRWEDYDPSLVQYDGSIIKMLEKVQQLLFENPVYRNSSQH